MSPDLESDLRVLVFQAFELRGNPYLLDAVQAILDRFEREPLAASERHKDQQACLLRLLRETNSRALRIGKAAAKSDRFLTSDIEDG